MRRLLLTAAMTFLGFLLFAPPAWADWVWPLRGEVITPYRNGSDPYASGQHRGIDIAGDTGTPVVAAAGGEVRFAGTAGSSGLTVSVRTADGRYDTSYLHLSATTVREGDRIAAGERLGMVGTTGVRSASPPHLHFGIRDAGSRHGYHDPLGFLPPPPPPPAAPGDAPASQPAPAPAAPAPAPAPVRVPAGRRVPTPTPRRVPATAPRPIPAPAPRRVPRPAPHGIPRTAPRGAPGMSPDFAPRAAPDGVGGAAPRAAPGATPHDVPRTAPHLPRGASPHDASAAVPRRWRGAALARAAAPAPHADGTPLDSPARSGAAAGLPHAGTKAGSGLDLGLMLACLGVLAAAGLLGLTRDGQKASRRAGHRIARVLRPLAGRR